MDSEFGLTITTGLDFEQAVLRTRVSLQAKGFGILSEMRPPPEPGSGGRHHLFMSVWQRLISTGNLGGPGLDVGDHLSLNVVVFEHDEATHVAVLDPTVGMEGWLELEVGREARRALEEALEQVAEPNNF